MARYQLICFYFYLISHTSLSHIASLFVSVTTLVRFSKTLVSQKSLTSLFPFCQCYLYISSRSVMLPPRLDLRLVVGLLVYDIRQVTHFLTWWRSQSNEYMIIWRFGSDSRRVTTTSVWALILFWMTWFSRLWLVDIDQSQAWDPGQTSVARWDRPIRGAGSRSNHFWTSDTWRHSKCHFSQCQIFRIVMPNPPPPSGWIWFQSQIDPVENRGTYIWTVISKTSPRIIRSKTVF